MKIRNVISARQFDKKTLEAIFTLADKIKQGRYSKKALLGKIMATVFYEPSTRTRLSFESAMLRLGGGVIATENASQFSSAAKGETLEDTIRIVDSYCDVIVLRHVNPGASEIASKYSRVPIINAGDGNGEHPTQALLDLYTIFSKFRKANFAIAMIGDLKNGRTIHSLSYLLSLYKKINMIFISPKALAIPKPLKDHLIRQHISFEESDDFKYGLKNGDVVYQTRIQKERFASLTEYQKYFGQFVLDIQALRVLKKGAVIMHPLPRVNEIAKAVDDDPRAIYFEQAANGVIVRMALLSAILSK